MLASIFAAVWFAVWAWYAITIISQAHSSLATKGLWLVLVVAIIALAVSVIPIILLAV